jgi:hypothetical protein
MKIYHYDSYTKKFFGSSDARLDPLESEKQGKKIYLMPAFSTTIEPPEIGVNEAAIFDTTKKSWEIKIDYTMKPIYKKEDGSQNPMIEEFGVDIPDDCTTIPPPKDFKHPKFVDEKWIDNSIFFKKRGRIFKRDKASVDLNTSTLVKNLGEDKVKTLKMIAGDGYCPEWDNFLIERQKIIDEGNEFIIDNDLK